MPETDTIPVSASVASTGKGIRYIGNWAYALSGPVNVDNTETDLLNFTTGSGVIHATIQFNYIIISGDDFQYKVYFNDEEVQGYIVPGVLTYGTASYPMEILIPRLL